LTCIMFNRFSHHPNGVNLAYLGNDKFGASSDILYQW
jgi:hypothetical protein